MHNPDPYQFPSSEPLHTPQWLPPGASCQPFMYPMMAAPQIKMEPLDIKTEPDSNPKKKKGSAGRPKKVKQEKITDHMTVTKKKRDRFKGMSEEEVMARLLPDHLAEDLDIVIVGINPGLFAAFVGHHYAGPGNHFWKCMYLSGLIPEPMNAMQDFKLLDYGIGFTNIVARTTRGSADLTRKEIKEGAQILIEKLRKYKPKIAVFNGKGIYEVFCGHKNFHFGKQPDKLEGTDTAVYVMPSSSARCSQLPRAVDKVPFYAALKKFRDHLKGDLPDLDESEIYFPDLELKTVKKEVKTEPDQELNTSQESLNSSQQSLPDSMDQLSNFTQGSYQLIPHTPSTSSPPSSMPQQTVTQPIPYGMIKQEPGTYNQSTCNQSSPSSQTQFSMSQSYTPLSVNNQLHSSLQGMYGMLNSVAHQVSMQMGPNNQKVQYSQALYGIVKEENTYDLDEYGRIAGCSQTSVQNTSQSSSPQRESSHNSSGNMSSQPSNHSSSQSPSSSQSSADYQTLTPLRPFNPHPTRYPHHYTAGQYPPGFSSPPGQLTALQTQGFPQMTSIQGHSFPQTTPPRSSPSQSHFSPGELSPPSGVPQGVVIKQEKQDDGYPC